MFLFRVHTTQLNSVRLPASSLPNDLPYLDLDLAIVGPSLPNSTPALYENLSCRPSTLAHAEPA
jgi:hypothetical protein